MSKVEHRRFTAEQKLENLREAEQPGVTVSAACRRPRHSMVGERWPTAVPEDRLSQIDVDDGRCPASCP